MRKYVLAGKGGGGMAPASLSIVDNSTGPKKKPSGYRARSKAALAWNVQREAERNPEGVGFLTLTLGDWRDGKWNGISEIEEVGRRWNSIRRHLMDWLKVRCMVAVPERHKNGNWHLHVFVSGGVSIRRGYQRGQRAGKALQAQWATLRRKLPGFGFGRHQWEPVMSVGACGRYLGKYLGKGMEESQPGEKKTRLVRYCGDWGGRMMAKGWSWNTAGGAVHRRVLRAFGIAWGVSCSSDWQAGFRRIFGKRWCSQIWGWWTFTKNRNFTVKSAILYGESEGYFPEMSSGNSALWAAVAVAFKSAGMETGKTWGVIPWRKSMEEEIMEW